MTRPQQHPAKRGRENATPTAELPPSARLAAARVIARHAIGFPNLNPAEPETSRLDDRDAALAHAITDGVVSRWMTLSYLLDTVLDRPLASLQVELQGVLLSGAAQLLLLDRIPVHAAIDESVELSKGFVRLGAAPMVNAVLRRVAAMRGETFENESGETNPILPTDAVPLRGTQWIKLVGVSLPKDSLERLGIATSHPLLLLRHWEQKLGPDAPRALAFHSLVSPPTILNTRFAREALPSILEAHEAEGHHVFTGTRAELIALLGSRRDVWVQDPSSSAAIEHARHLKPRIVIDLCAGQGTKTRQLAATFPNAEIVASDPDATRSRTLREAFAGSSQVRVMSPEELLAQYLNRADLILLDVPCSNTGVLARRREAKYRAGAEPGTEAGGQMARFMALQRSIVERAMLMLSRSPRGKILYATCSIDARENRDVAEWACSKHRLRIEHEVVRLPEGLASDPPRRYRDGSYSALLG